MTSIICRKVGRTALRILAPLVSFIGLWWAVATLLDSPLLLPAPDAVFLSFLSLLSDGGFFGAVAFSFLRVLGGLGIGIAGGILLSLLVFFLPRAEVFVKPFLTVVRATPVASFVMLIWCFTGSSVLPLVIAALMVLPIVSENLIAGLRSAPSSLLEVARVFRLSARDTFFHCRVPAAVPSLLSALRSSAGFAWKAGIAAEILSTAAPSVGRMIYYAKVYMETEKVFSLTVAVILLSLLFEFIVNKTFHILQGGRKSGGTSVD